MADGSGGEEVGAGEFFLSGITACAVNMVDELPAARRFRLTGWMSAWKPIETPDRASIANEGNVSVYDDIKVHFQIWGVDDDQGQYLVDQ